VQGSKRNGAFEKTSGQIKGLLKKMSGSHQEVIFSGGEATLMPYIVDCVRYAKQLGYTVQIQSNGRLFCYSDFCQQMGAAGVDVVSVSVHGHTSELHDALTRVPGSFEQTMNGIRNLLALRLPSVVTNTVITSLNYRDLPALAQMLIGEGVRQYQFAFPHILGFAYENRGLVVPRKTDVMPFVIKGLQIGLRNNAFPKTEAIPYCFLKGYEACCSENYSIETTAVDLQFAGDFTRWRKEEGKAKGLPCASCSCDSICEGPWREYPALYGWDEFKPVHHVR